MSQGLNGTNPMLQTVSVSGPGRQVLVWDSVSYLGLQRLPFALDWEAAILTIVGASTVSFALR